MKSNNNKGQNLGCVDKKYILRKRKKTFSYLFPKVGEVTPCIF